MENKKLGGVGLSAADRIFRNLHWLWYCVFGYGSGKSFGYFPRHVALLVELRLPLFWHRG